ncbi:hypothetical protein EBX93_10800 [bacterium]|jgi:hypothetical protein|nr:hypothetical protein [bacterium]
MSKYSALVLVVLGASFWVSTGNAQEKSQNEKSYYPLNAGNKWTYQIESDNIPKGSAKLVNQIAKIEKIDNVSLARLETTAKERIAATEHLSVNEKGIFRHRYNGVEITPPICLLKFPIKKNDSWKTESVTGKEKVKMACKSDEEEIEVPAGKFKTVKVVLDAEVVDAGIIVSTTYWFASRTGIVKQHVNINGMQFSILLEKFEEGK